MAKSTKKSSMKEARSKVEDEIISSEKVYVNNLHQLVENFLVPLRQKSVKGGFTIIQVNTIFANVEIILNFHRTFLTELETRKVTDAFLKFSDFLKLYTAYINTYEAALKSIDSLKNNNKFQDHIKTMQKQGEDLCSLLITPVQRIPRYEILLAQLKKYTPTDHKTRAALDSSFQKVQSIAQFVNEGKLKSENMTKMLKLQNKLKNIKFQLFIPHRALIHEGNLSKVENNGKEREKRLILFNDIIIWASADGKYEDMRGLTGLDVRILTTAEYGFTLVQRPKKEIHFTCSQADLLRDWTDAIITTRDKLRKVAESRSRIVLERRQTESKVEERSTTPTIKSERGEEKQDKSQSRRGRDMCGRCNKVCTKQYLKTSDGIFYHLECLKCDHCGYALEPSESFIVRGDSNLHEICAMQVSECSKCQKPIHGKYIEVHNRVYHPECFSCHTCEASLDSGYGLKGGEPHCDGCIQREDGVDLVDLGSGEYRCAKCKKDLLDVFVEAADQMFHQECFRCFECEAALDDGYIHQGTLIICVGCSDKIHHTKEQKAKDQNTKDQKTKDQKTKDQKTKDQKTKDQKAKDQKPKEPKPKHDSSKKSSDKHSSRKHRTRSTVSDLDILSPPQTIQIGRLKDDGFDSDSSTRSHRSKKGRSKKESHGKKGERGSKSPPTLERKTSEPTKPAIHGLPPPPGAKLPNPPPTMRATSVPDFPSGPPPPPPEAFRNVSQPLSATALSSPASSTFPPPSSGAGNRQIPPTHNQSRSPKHPRRTLPLNLAPPMTIVLKKGKEVKLPPDPRERQSYDSDSDDSDTASQASSYSSQSYSPRNEMQTDLSKKHKRSHSTSSRSGRKRKEKRDKRKKSTKDVLQTSSDSRSESGDRKSSKSKKHSSDDASSNSHSRARSLSKNKKEKKKKDKESKKKEKHISKIEESVEVKFCPQCGEKKRFDDQIYCTKCGNNLELNAA